MTHDMKILIEKNGLKIFENSLQELQKIQLYFSP